MHMLKGLSSSGRWGRGLLSSMSGTVVSLNGKYSLGKLE
jgi:hypothetical protein